MDIKLVSRGSEGELLLDGRLDSNTSPETEEIFNTVSRRFEYVVLNMAKLEYVSSAGLRVIRNLHVKMGRKGGTLLLKNVNSTVMDVLELTGFAALLKIE